MLGFLKKKKEEPKAAAVKVNSFGESLDKLVDGELPFGWYAHNQDVVQEMNVEHDRIYAPWKAVHHGSPAEECAAIKQYLQDVEVLRAKCYGLGECCGHYFSTTIAGEGWLQHAKDTLANLETDLDVKMQEYNARKEHERLWQEFAETVTKEMLLEQIELHEEILQTDLYKLYDHPCAKDVLKEKLYFMEAEGLIERTKSGRTYLLKTKK